LVTALDSDLVKDLVTARVLGQDLVTALDSDLVKDLVMARV
jgi:hypothetical protein